MTFNLNCFRNRGKKSVDRRRSQNKTLPRRLRLESLESRELLAVWTVNVATTTDVGIVDATNHTGDLRGILTSSSLADGDTVVFDSAVFAPITSHKLTFQTPDAANRTINIAKSITIDGGIDANGDGVNDSMVQISASSTTGNRTSLFTVNDGSAATNSKVTIRDLRITSFNDSAIITSEELEYVGGSITGCWAYNADGGAIRCLTSEKLTVDNVTFFFNYAWTDGTTGGNGASISSANFSISNSRFDYNCATADGGAIYRGVTSPSYICSIDSSTFTGNEAGYNGAGNGGAVANMGGVLEIRSTTGAGDANKITTFTNNQTIGNGDAAGFGGAIYNAGTITQIVSTTPLLDAEYDLAFYGNAANRAAEAVAGGDGGAIYNAANATATFGKIYAEKNLAAGDGGALFNLGATTSGVGSSFAYNTANSSGGAICNKGTFVCNSGTTPTAASPYDFTTLGNKATGTIGASTGSGGAIYNAAGAILNLGKGNFEQNDAAKDGGAICDITGGTATIGAFGRFAGNSANAGGAIFFNVLSGTTLNVTLDSCAFSDNTADTNGGAIVAGSSQNNFLLLNCSFTGNVAQNGGAVRSGAATFTVKNSTFQQNCAYPMPNSGLTDVRGGALSCTSVTIEGSTFRSNHCSAFFDPSQLLGEGGAIYVSRQINVDQDANGGVKTTFVGNEAANGGAIYSAFTIYASTVKNADFSENKALNNGGAIYAGFATVLMNDVNFTSNEANSGGAVYYVGDNDFQMTSNVVFTQNTATTKGGAIYAERGRVSTNDVVFSLNSAASGGAIYLTNVLAPNVGFNSAAVLESFDEGTIVSNSRVSYSIEYAGSATTFTNNSATNGGAIYNDIGFDAAYQYSMITALTDCAFTSNTATENGGAIYNAKKAFVREVRGTTFASNSAVGDGGAIYNDGYVDLYDSSFTSNSATNGGAIYNNHEDDEARNAVVTVQGLLFDRNSATNCGGAIYNVGIVRAVDQTIIADYDCVFTSNTAINATDSSLGNGGAIYSSGYSTLELARIRCANNETSGNGGAIFVNSHYVEIGSTSLFEGNSATAKGGAIYYGDGPNMFNPVSLDKCDFNNNTAATGGAISAEDPTYLIVTGGSFRDNVAENGGAVDFCVLDIDGVVFEGNIARQNGGALRGTTIETAVASTFTGNKCLSASGDVVGSGGACYIANSGNFVQRADDRTSFTDNEAANGGAIYYAYQGSRSPDLTIAAVDFTNNRATNGGAIYNGAKYYSPISALTDCAFSANSATENGGAIYNAANARISSITEANFEGNTAQKAGGAIYNAGTITTVASTDGAATPDLVFRGNVAVLGGAVCNLNASTDSIKTTYTNVLFDGNQATTSHGGAIYNGAKNEIELNGCSFAGNWAGGGIVDEQGGVAGAGLVSDGNGWYKLTDYTRPNDGNNSSAVHYGTYADGVYSVGSLGGNGGAIANAGTTVVLGGSFSNNAARYGGAMMNVGTLRLNDGVSLTNNVAGANGGAISNSGSGNLILNQYWQGYVGGGSDGAQITIDGNIAVGASDDATGFGGAIYNSGAICYIGSTTLTNNVARMDGGAICNAANTTMYLFQSVVVGGSEGNGNVAQCGGGIMNAGALSLSNGAVSRPAALISHNEARVNGGGISSTSSLSTQIENGAGYHVRVENNSAYFWAGGLLVAGGQFDVGVGGEGTDLQLVVTNNAIVGDTTNPKVHANTADAYIKAGVSQFGATATAVVGTNNPVVYSASNPFGTATVVANSAKFTFVDASGLQNIALQQGSAVVLEATGLDAATTTYGYDFDGDGIDDLTTGSVLTAKELGDQVGSRSVVLSIYENGVLFDKLNVVASIAAQPIAVEVKADSLAGGQIGRLSVDVAASSAPVARWIINWGDGTETVVDSLASSETFAHRYAPTAQTAEFATTLVLVDADGVRSEAFDVATFVVPATVAETEPNRGEFAASVVESSDERPSFVALAANPTAKRSFNQAARRALFAEYVAPETAPVATREFADDATNELWFADFDESTLDEIALDRSSRQDSDAEDADAFGDLLGADWDAE